MPTSLLIFFTIVVGIPVGLGIGSDMFKRWLRLKERQMEIAAHVAADKAAAQAAHLEKLEQRMRVLERIAIDRGADLAAEIDLLRDERAN